MFLPVSKEGGLCASCVSNNSVPGVSMFALPFSFLPFESPVNEIHGASLVTHMVKNPPEIPETRVPSLGCIGKISRRRAWQPTPVFLPGESRGQRSLAGWSPWGHVELDMTEVT